MGPSRQWKRWSQRNLFTTSLVSEMSSADQSSSGAGFLPAAFTLSVDEDLNVSEHTSEMQELCLIIMSHFSGSMRRAMRFSLSPFNLHGTNPLSSDESDSTPTQKNRPLPRTHSKVTTNHLPATNAYNLVTQDSKHSLSRQTSHGALTIESKIMHRDKCRKLQHDLEDQLRKLSKKLEKVLRELEAANARLIEAEYRVTHARDHLFGTVLGLHT